MSSPTSKPSDIPAPRTDIDFGNNRQIILIGFPLILITGFLAWYFFFRPFPVDSAIPHYTKTSDVTGTLLSVGSDTLLDAMIHFARGFKEQYPNVTIQIEGKGSATAPPALIDGKSQLAPMSRVMTDDEVGSFEKKYGYKPTAYKVAIDSLTVYVNKGNPIKGMTLQQLDGVFSSTFKRGGTSIENWGALGLTGDWATRPISLYGRDIFSGTHAYFKEHALAGGDYKTSVHEEDSEDVVESTGNDIAGIGYSGIGWKTSEVRAIPLGESADNFVEPNYKNCLNGTYPLTRFLYIYVNQQPGQPPDRLTNEFIKYVLSREGQETVVEVGFFPLTARIVSDTLSGKN